MPGRTYIPNIQGKILNNGICITYHNQSRCRIYQIKTTLMWFIFHVEDPYYEHCHCNSKYGSRFFRSMLMTSIITKYWATNKPTYTLYIIIINLINAIFFYRYITSWVCRRRSLLPHFLHLQYWIVYNPTYWYLSSFEDKGCPQLRKNKFH